MTDFPQGSEWRKWDLHLHAPGTHLSDDYGLSEEAWERYCEILAESDVSVLGIADYFSFDGFFACREHFSRLHPNVRKVLLPNLELRLNESVNRDAQDIDVHLILRPDLDSATAELLLRELKTELTDPTSGRALSCADLNTTAHFEGATVTRANLESAIAATFGKGRPRTDRVLLLVPANNSGIRAASGRQRKANLADTIDRMADAIFGSEVNTNYFLDPNRTEDASLVVAKPVFSGCDAHSLDQLKHWLGKEITVPDNRKTVTWVKADPTFEGLLQTLAEPEARVRIQTTRPDPKEPYKYLSAVRFSGTDDFPSEIPLNQNLVSIIGSRSSGKSALLAYIAHAIDPQHTEAQQLAAEPTATAKTIGPAPGKTWGSVADIECTVAWGEPNAKTGRVIYIPQNSLYAISERPEEITAKIQPTLYRLDLDFKAAHQQMRAEIQTANETIRNGVTEWFRILAALDAASRTLHDLGDRDAIEHTRDNLSGRIASLREASSLTQDESETYQQLVDQLGVIAVRLRNIEAETQQLAPHLTVHPDETYSARPSVGVEIRAAPPVADLPGDLQPEITDLLGETATGLAASVQQILVDYQVGLDTEASKVREREATLRADNADLISKNRANAEIETLVTSRKTQDEALVAIEAEAKNIAELKANRANEITQIEQAIAERTAVIDRLQETFSSKPRVLQPMTFGFERQLSPTAQESLSERVNRKETGPFFDRDSSRLDIEACQASPADFLEAIRSGKQKIRSGQETENVSADALTATPEVRFYAEIEGDRVGGFSPSSMTPGKQALFALTLILNESEEAWPLLIDQPEDDLDSRSIYDVLVTYLAVRKTERQIIMVSHNANLVIGADSEQVIVANRHGVDRQNACGQAFDYFTGSLEHTRERAESAVVFEVGGIREHACDILDGGEDAFRKRKEKYKI